MEIAKMPNLTPQQIEGLMAGPTIDATIENHFFGFVIYGRTSRTYLVDEHPDDPDVNTRSPRQFSTSPLEALKILEASPGWRAWHWEDGIHIQLTRTVGDGLTWINSVGIDSNFAKAICKAALLLCYFIREWEEKQRQIDLAGDVTLEMTAEYAPAAPENQIKIKDKA